MNKTQIRARLKSVNVSQFAERHAIPIRTLWRVKKRGSSPSKRTLSRIEAAILKDDAAGITS